MQGPMQWLKRIFGRSRRAETPFETPRVARAARPGAQAGPTLGSKERPVLCDGPTGERAYLSRLRGPGGQRPAYRRIGSAGEAQDGHILDLYVLSADGAGCDVYMDMYHEGHVESAAVPGFTIVSEAGSAPASPLGNAAAMALAAGRAQEARDLLRKAIAADEASGNRRSMGSSFALLGTVEAELGNAAAVRDAMGRAIALYAETGEPRHRTVISCFLTLAVSERRAGRAKESRSALSRARDIAVATLSSDDPLRRSIEGAWDSSRA